MTPHRTPDQSSSQTQSLRLFVFALFFFFGGITSLNDVLIPKLKDLFTLSYTQAMLVQSAFFFAYFVVSMPASILVKKLGYLRCAALGLLVMTTGCLLFIPAVASGLFPAFLLALFALAAGVTIVQVVANPLISLLGSPATTSSRLTFAQAFNALGTTVFPFCGAWLILGSLATADPQSLSGVALTAFRAQEARVVQHTYLGIAVILVCVAALVWKSRNRLQEAHRAHTPILASLDLLKNRRFAFGTLGLFLYVGAEVSIGSLLVSYLMQPTALGWTARQAGELVSLYWGDAMAGRFLGAYVLTKITPPLALKSVAAAAIVLLILAAAGHGIPAAVAILAIGLFNSIMFPTIFSLACEGLGDRAAEGSGLICMAIVGGAVMPLLTGLLADHAGLHGALLIPALCYTGIALFARYCRRHPVT